MSARVCVASGPGNGFPGATVLGTPWESRGVQGLMTGVGSLQDSRPVGSSALRRQRAPVWPAGWAAEEGGV